MMTEKIPLPRIVGSGGQTVRRIRPIRVSLNLAITPLSYASMELEKGETLPERSYVELYTCMGSAGIYRVRSPQEAYGNDQMTAELEHAVVEVGDWLVLTEYEQMMGAAAAMRAVFSHYRGGRWQLGDVNALGTSQVALTCSHDKVLTAMLNILDQRPECMMTFDFTTTPWTINFAQRGSTVAAEGRLSRNVDSARVSYDDSELCTRAYYEVQIMPEDDEDDPTTEWRTLDADTIGQYGVIERVVPTGRGFTVSEASHAAAEYIRKHKKPRISVEISAVELSSKTGEELDTFTIGKLFRLVLADYGTTVEENITGLYFPDVYGKPQNINVSLAAEEDSNISFLHAIDRYGGTADSEWVQEQDEAFKDAAMDIATNQYSGARTRQQLNIVETRVDEAGNILQEAGMSLDAQGLIVYAQDNERNIGSKFQVASDSIAMVVGTNNGVRFIKAAEIIASVNATTGEGTATLNADHVNISATNRVQSLAGVMEVDANGQLVFKPTGGMIVERTDGGTTAQFGLYDEGNLTGGIMVQKINNQTTAKISGDKVLIAGDTTIQGTLDIQNGALVVKKVAVFQGTNAQATINDGKVNAHTVQVSASGSLKILGPSSGEYYDLDYRNVPNLITDLQLTENNHVYTLKKKTVYQNSAFVDFNPPITFSGATTLGQTIGSNKIVVTATPQGNTVSYNIMGGNPGITWNGNTASVPVKVTIDDGETVYDTGRRITVDAGDRYSAGYDACAANIDIDPYEGKTLSYGESVIVKATYINRTTGLPTTAASITLTAPDNNYNSGYANGYDACVSNISISPSADTTLAYGGSVTVSAQYVNRSTGLPTTAASIVVSAPADRYNTGYADGYDACARNVSISPSSSQTLGYGGSVTVRAQYTSRSSGSKVTADYITVTAPSSDYQNGYDEGYSDGETAGYNSGYDDGYDAGIAMGGDDGDYNTGYADGYSEGYRDGVNDTQGGTSLVVPNWGQVQSIGTDRGNRANAGAISKSALRSRTYLGFTVQLGGNSNIYQDFYITVND